MLPLRVKFRMESAIVVENGLESELELTDSTVKSILPQGHSLGK